MGEFGIGERAPRHQLGGGAATGQEHVAHRDHGVVCGGVRELGAAGCRVTDDVDARHERAIAAVDVDTAGPGGDTEPIEPQRIDVRRPSGRNDEAGGREPAVGGVDDDTVASRPYGGGGGREVQLDPLGAEYRRQTVGQLGFVARHEAVGHLQHRGADAEPHHRLRQLGGDRSAADHHQRLRRAIQFEDVLAGEELHLGETGNRWNRRTAPRADEDESGRQPARTAGSLHGDLAVARDAALALDEFDTELTEPIRCSRRWRRSPLARS